MKPKTIALTLPLEGILPRGVRAVSAAMVGAVAGLALAVGAGLSPTIPLLCGIAIGLAIGSPSRPKGLEAWASRTVLAVGGAFAAGSLFASGAIGWAWPVAAASMAIATGSRSSSAVGHVGRFLTCMCAIGAALAVASLGIDLRLTTWGAGQLVEVLLLSSALGCAVWMGGSLGLRLVAEEVAASPKPRLLAEPPARPRKTTSTFSDEIDHLERTEQRILRIAEELSRIVPEEAGFVDQVRATLASTLESAASGIERWRLVEASGSKHRIDSLRSRIEANRARLSDTEEGRLHTALETTVQRQVQALAEHEGLIAAQSAFGLRLQQLGSGLELLELALERALTAGGELDSSDIDGIVDAMSEVNSTLREEFATLPA